MACMVSRFTRIYETQIKKTNNILNKNIDTNIKQYKTKKQLLLWLSRANGRWRIEGIKKERLQCWLKVKAKYRVYVVYNWSEFRVSILTFYILFTELLLISCKNWLGELINFKYKIYGWKFWTNIYFSIYL